MFLRGLDQRLRAVLPQNRKVVVNVEQFEVDDGGRTGWNSTASNVCTIPTSYFPIPTSYSEARGSLRDHALRTACLLLHSTPRRPPRLPPPTSRPGSTSFRRPPRSAGRLSTSSRSPRGYMRTRRSTAIAILPVACAPSPRAIATSTTKPATSAISSSNAPTTSSRPRATRRGSAPTFATCHLSSLASPRGSSISAMILTAGKIGASWSCDRSLPPLP